MIGIIIFDFDGVIHNTTDFHYEKIKAFHNLPNLKMEEYQNVLRGNFYEDHGGNVLHGLCWEWYPDFIQELTTLKTQERIKESIIQLSTTYRLYVNTSWAESIIKEYLKRNGLFAYFENVYGAETSRSKVEKFHKIRHDNKSNFHEMLFITDSLWDIKEAHEVWIKTLAVDYGIGTLQDFEIGQPHKVISCLSEVEKEIHSIFA